jgi:hypothetical protein
MSIKLVKCGYRYSRLEILVLALLYNIAIRIHCLKQMCTVHIFVFIGRAQCVCYTNSTFLHIRRNGSRRNPSGVYPECRDCVIMSDIQSLKVGLARTYVYDVNIVHG